MSSSFSFSAAELFEREFPEIRARLLQLAAAFDRIERAADSETLARDHRLGKITQSLEVLLGSEPHRAEQIQLIFSRPYPDQWRTDYQMPAAQD